MFPSFSELAWHSMVTLSGKTALEDEEFNIILKFKAGHEVLPVNQVALYGLRKALDDMKMV